MHIAWCDDTAWLMIVGACDVPLDGPGGRLPSRSDLLWFTLYCPQVRQKQEIERVRHLQRIVTLDPYHDGGIPYHRHA